jgi:tetratricopeptide (TPR) repeat protein
MENTFFVKSLLDLEALWARKSDAHVVLQHLDCLSKKLVLCNINLYEPLRQLYCFKHVLFDQEGFCSGNGKPWSDFTLSGTIYNRSGSCLGLTTVYFALSELLNLPLKPVLFEGHVAIVYSDNDSCEIYVETQSGNIVNHPFIYLGMKIIRILSSEEFLAVHLSNSATQCYARAGLLDDAVFLIDSALELFPDYTAGWINRAVMMKKLNRIDEMNRSLDMAKSLHPGPRYTQAIEQIEGEKV